jgi:hypothetical protein
MVKVAVDVALWATLKAMNDREWGGHLLAVVQNPLARRVMQVMYVVQMLDPFLFKDRQGLKEEMSECIVEFNGFPDIAVNLRFLDDYGPIELLMAGNAEFEEAYLAEAASNPAAPISEIYTILFSRPGMSALLEQALRNDHYKTLSIIVWVIRGVLATM